MGRGRSDEARARCCAFPIRELQGRIFGVVGWGELGRGAARIAEAFGMRVVIANRRGAPAADRSAWTLDELLAIADILSLHCPLNDCDPRSDRRARAWR